MIIGVALSGDGEGDRNMIDNMTNEKLFGLFYEACLEAVKVLGDDIKTVSWLGNWKRGKIDG